MHYETDATHSGGRVSSIDFLNTPNQKSKQYKPLGGKRLESTALLFRQVVDSKKYSRVQLLSIEFIIYTIPDI